MLTLEENDGAGGLAVEGGGDVEDGILDDLLYLLIGDGRLGLEGVDRTTVLDQFEERARLETGHVGGCLCC